MKSSMKSNLNQDMSEIMENVVPEEITKEGHKMSRYVMGSSPKRSGGTMKIKESVLGTPLTKKNLMSKISDNGDHSNGRNSEGEHNHLNTTNGTPIPATKSLGQGTPSVTIHHHNDQQTKSDIAGAMTPENVIHITKKIENSPTVKQLLNRSQAEGIKNMKSHILHQRHAANYSVPRKSGIQQSHEQSSPTSKQPSRFFGLSMDRNASKPIFNIQYSQNRNMLLNQDKYQNPVNRLQNKFEIISGQNSSNSMMAFGHTPIGGRTLVAGDQYLSKNKINEGLISIHQSENSSSPENQRTIENAASVYLVPQLTQKVPQQTKNQKLKINNQHTMMNPDAVKFNKLRMTTKSFLRQTNNTINELLDSNFTPFSVQASSIISPHEQRQGQSFAHQGHQFAERDQATRDNANQTQQIMPTQPMRVQRQYRSPQVLRSKRQGGDFDPRFYQTQANQKGQHPVIYRDTQRGFGVQNALGQNKNFSAVIVFDEPLNSIKDIHLGSPSEYQQQESRMGKPEKMSQNIHKSKYDLIQKERMLKQMLLSPPPEILSRHPHEIQKLRQHCRLLRESSLSPLKSIAPYLEMTPTQASREATKRGKNQGFDNLSNTMFEKSTHKTLRYLNSPTQDQSRQASLGLTFDHSQVLRMSPDYSIQNFGGNTIFQNDKFQQDLFEAKTAQSSMFAKKFVKNKQGVTDNTGLGSKSGNIGQTGANKSQQVSQQNYESVKNLSQNKFEQSFGLSNIRAGEDAELQKQSNGYLVVSPFKDTTRIMKQGSVPKELVNITVKSNVTSQTLNASAEGQFSPGQQQSFEYQPKITNMNIVANSLQMSPEATQSIQATYKTRLKPDQLTSNAFRYSDLEHVISKQLLGFSKKKIKSDKSKVNLPSVTRAVESATTNAGTSSKSSKFVDGPHPRVKDVKLNSVSVDLKQNFSSIGQKQQRMVEKYHATMEKNEWKQLPYKQKKIHDEFMAQITANGDTLPDIRKSKLAAPLPKNADEIIVFSPMNQRHQSQRSQGSSTKPFGNKSSIAIAPKQGNTTKNSFGITAGGGREGEWIDSQNEGPIELDHQSSQYSNNMVSSQTELNMRKRQLVEEYEEGRKQEQITKQKKQDKLERQERRKLHQRENETLSSNSDDASDDTFDPLKENEDVNYMKLFLRQERKQQMKCLIHDDVQDIIEQMDSIVARKKDQDVTKMKKQFERTNTKRNKQGKKNIEVMATMDLDLYRSLSNKNIGKMPSKLLKQLPKIVQDVIKEDQDNKKEPCKCTVRFIMKDFIRYLRDYNGDWTQVSAEIKEKMRQQREQNGVPLCTHAFEDDVKSEKQLVMIQIYEKFLDKFDTQEFKNKVRKPHIFRRFVKHVLSSPEIDPLVQEMQTYIKDNGLVRGLVNFSHFHRYNKFLALKYKKTKKLKEEEQKRNFSVDLEENFDSSDYEDLEFEPDGRLKEEVVQTGDLRLNMPSKFQGGPKFDVQQLNDELSLQNEQKDFLGFNISKSIVIDKKMFYNFLGPMLEPHDDNDYKFEDDPLDVDKQYAEPYNLEIDEALERIQKQQFEQALLHGITNTIKNLKASKKLLDERADATKMKRYTTKQSVDDFEIVDYDKDVDFVKRAMDAELEGNLEALEEKKSRINSKVLKMKRQQVSQVSSTSLGTIGSPAKIPQPNKNLDQSLGASLQRGASLDFGKKKPSIKSDQNKIKVFEKLADKQKFYQRAQRHVNHPTNKCMEEDPQAMVGFEASAQNKVVPRPFQRYYLKGNKLEILEETAKVAEIPSLMKLIQQAIKDEEVAIKSLLIDHKQVDDRTLSIVLKDLIDQPIGSITIINSTMGQQSLELLLEFIDKQYPNSVDELRLINVQGLHIKSIDTKILEALSTQNQIKTLQITGFNLNEQYKIDCLYELIQGDQHLKELDLSDVQISPQNLEQIMVPLCTNESLTTISFRGISALHWSETEEKDYNDWVWKNGFEEFDAPQGRRRELILGIVEQMKEMLEKNTNLQHLDISQMGLGEMILDLLKAVFLSANILAVHIGGNNLSKETMQQVGMIMQIDPNQVGDKLYESFLMSNLVAPSNDQTTELITSHNLQKQKPDKHQFTYKKPQQTAIYSHLMTESKNIIKEQIHTKDTTVKSYDASLVLFRKLDNKELIFNDRIQKQNFKHFNMKNSQAKWNLRLKDDECYVCQGYQFCQIFYRRSKAEVDFKHIGDRIQKMQILKKNNIQPEASHKDPYSSYPLLFGSFLDSAIPSQRMIRAMHQSALLWVDEIVSKEKRPGVKEQLYKTMVRGIQKIIKREKVSKTQLQQINSHLSEWRERLLDYKADIEVINKPIYDEKYPNEDDIFVYSGYMKPGIHNIMLYDPQTQELYMKENQVIFPRKEELQLVKGEEVLGDLEEQEVEIRNYQGQNYETIVSQIYGEVVTNFSKTQIEQALRFDTEKHMFDANKFAQIKNADSFWTGIKPKYGYIMKIWKILYVTFMNSHTLNIEMTQQQFTTFISKIIEDCKFTSQITKSDLDQTFQIVRDSIPNNGQFSRRMLLASLLRLSQLLVERKPDDYEDHLDAFQKTFMKAFEDNIVNNPSTNAGFNDFKGLVNKYVFKNKHLTILYKYNKDALKIIYDDFLRHETNGNLRRYKELDEDGRIVDFTKLDRPDVTQRYTFTFQKSLLALAERIQTYIKEKPNSISALKPTEENPDQNFELMADYEILLQQALQSKTEVINEDLQAPQMYRCLSFEEFLIFIVNVAVKCNVGSNEKDVYTLTAMARNKILKEQLASYVEEVLKLLFLAFFDVDRLDTTLLQEKVDFTWYKEVVIPEYAELLPDTNEERKKNMQILNIKEEVMDNEDPKKNEEQTEDIYSEIGDGYDSD